MQQPQQPQKKREDPSKTTFRDRYDPTNASYYEAQRQRELEEQKLQQRPSYLRRKFNRIFGGLGQTGSKFMTGFYQGAMVGAVIGLVSGAFIGVKTRRLSLFLASPVISAGSFGFIMGVGYILRSEPLSEPNPNATVYPDGKEWILRKI